MNSPGVQNKEENTGEAGGCGIIKRKQSKTVEQTTRIKATRKPKRGENEQIKSRKHY